MALPHDGFVPQCNCFFPTKRRSQMAAASCMRQAPWIMPGSGWLYRTYWTPVGADLCPLQEAYGYAEYMPGIVPSHSASPFNPSLTENSMGTASCWEPDKDLGGFRSDHTYVAPEGNFFDPVTAGLLATPAVWSIQPALYSTQPIDVIPDADLETQMAAFHDVPNQPTFVHDSENNLIEADNYDNSTIPPLAVFPNVSNTMSEISSAAMMGQSRLPPATLLVPMLTPPVTTFQPSSGEVMATGQNMYPQQPDPKPHTSSATRTKGPAPETWQARKLILGTIYRDQNMPLNDVRRYMESHHKFRATTKMYKTQFKNWGWEKYQKGSKSPRERRDDPRTLNRKTCVRDRRGLNIQLLHENTATRLVEKAVSTLQHYVEISAPKEPRWQTTSKFEFVEWNTSDNVHLHNHFDQCLHKILNGHVDTGTGELQLCIDQLANVLKDISFSGFFMLATEITYLYLLSEAQNRLPHYFERLRVLSVGQRGKHTMGDIAAALYELTQFDGKYMIQYVSAAMGVYANLLRGRYYGELDWTAILEYRGAAGRSNRLGVGKMGYLEWRAKEFIIECDALKLEGVESGEATEADFLDLDDDILEDTYQTDIYLDDFESRSRLWRGAISDRYADVGASMSDWDPLDARKYLASSCRLVDYFLSKDDNEGAFHFLPEIRLIFSLAGVEILCEHYSFVFPKLLIALRADGRAQDADTLQRLLSEMPTYCSMCEVVDKTRVTEVDEDSEL